MKIEKQFAIFHITASWGMGVANQEMSASMFTGIGSDPTQHVQPASVAGVVFVHQADLAKMNGLDPHIDVAGDQEIEPHPGLNLGHIGDRAVASPAAHETAVGVKHFLLVEGSIRHGLTEFAQDLLRKRNGVYASADDFEGSHL